jgi:hypothetical protein
MIVDPIPTVVQNVSGAGLETAAVALLERIAPGPGSQSTWKGTTPIIGVITRGFVKHEVTKGNRRRSSIRMDVTAPEGTTIITSYAAPGPRSASAYLVVDRLEQDDQDTKALADFAVSQLINALLVSKSATNTVMVASSVLTDFLNGEP